MATAQQVMTEATSKEAQGSYHASEMPLGLDKELERLRWQAQVYWKKELRNLQWFGLRDGMKILEPGSGPGFITELLLRDLPHSTVTMLDIDQELNQRAEQYLKDKFADRFNIVNASITNSGLADNSFDFAFARLIFQHLPNPLAAAREVFRLLKPGGTFAIYDIDGGAPPIVDPEAPDELIAVYKRLMQQQEERGGNRKIGRRLWRLLANAGFQNMELELLGISSDEVGQEILDALSTVDPEGENRVLVEQGRITQEEAELMTTNYREFSASPDKYMLIFVMMVAGKKPLSPTNKQ